MSQYDQFIHSHLAHIRMHTYTLHIKVFKALICALVICTVEIGIATDCNMKDKHIHCEFICIINFLTK